MGRFGMVNPDSLSVVNNADLRGFEGRFAER